MKESQKSATRGNKKMQQGFYSTDVAKIMARNDPKEIKRLLPEWEGHATIGSQGLEGLKLLLLMVSEETKPGIVCKLVETAGNDVNIFDFVRSMLVALGDKYPPADVPKDILKALNENEPSVRIFNQIIMLKKEQVSSLINYLVNEIETLDIDFTHAILKACVLSNILPQREIALITAACIKTTAPLAEIMLNL